jgi:endo-1,4-beta-D-glucanase Y
MKYFTLLILFFAFFGQSNAQNFPFPQNAVNSFGIMPSNRNHNDVDTTYSNWKNNHVTTQGAGGFRRVVWDTLRATVSEGIAYGMLISVNMNDRLLFDDLWNYYYAHRDPDGFMIWILDSLGGPLVINGFTIGTGGATDADQDAAYALILANAQWGSSGTINYLSEAVSLVNKIYQYEIDSTYHLVKSGNEPGGIYRVNCSYFAPAYYRAFEYITGNPGWTLVRNACYNFLLFRADANTGLVPDWCLPNGDPMPPCPPPYSCRFTYYYDATRTPLRIAMDYIWHGEPLAYLYCKKVSMFAQSQGSANITDEYSLTGTPMGIYHSNGFIGPFGAGTLATDITMQNFSDSIYSENVSVFEPHWNYYNSSLKVISLLMMTGNFIKGQYVLPVDLLSFVSVVNKNEVKLSWATNTEENNSGFDIERKNDNAWERIGFVQGKGNSNMMAEYSFTDKNLSSGTYKYRLKQIDFNGNYKYYELNTDVIIGVPLTSKLNQNYPNPFNPTTTISFELGQAGIIQLALYDLSGRLVMNMFNGYMEAGYNTYKLNAKNLASGVYYYVLKTDNFSQTKKLAIIK